MLLPNEESLECSACPWRGQEAEAVEFDMVNDDGYGYACPACGEECAHVPMDELER
jgi:hypothetical protein